MTDTADAQSSAGRRCPPGCTRRYPYQDALMHTYEDDCLQDPLQLPHDTVTIGQPVPGRWAWRCRSSECDGWVSFQNASAAAARRAYDRHVYMQHGRRRASASLLRAMGMTELAAERFPEETP